MARKPKTAADRHKAVKTRVMTLVCLVLGVIVAAMPTVIVLCIGMIPTIVAYIIDLTPGRYATRCVAALNFAGVIPFLDRLWSSTNDMYAAIGIITDVFAWLAFYVASGIGWLLFLGLPSLVASFKTYNAKRKANILRQRIEELKVEWGAEVTGQTAEGESARLDGPIDGAPDVKEAAHPA